MIAPALIAAAAEASERFGDDECEAHAARLRADPGPWNSRYLAYCRWQGRARDPVAQLEADRLAWPGGQMAGFMLWTAARWREWEWAHFGKRRATDIQRKMAAVDGSFDIWLDAWSPVGT